MENDPRSFQEEDDEELLTLSLSTGPSRPPPRNRNVQILPPQDSPSPYLPQPPPPPQIHNVQNLPPQVVPPSPYLQLPPPSLQSGPTAPSSSRKRRASETIWAEKSHTIPAPYTWASTFRAVVPPLKQLLDDGVTEVSGQMHCKDCYQKFEIKYDLKQKFEEVAAFVKQNMENMHDRAPEKWMNPVLPDCVLCRRLECARPVNETGKKRNINWLFLLLGQMVGCCTLPQLKYFCKHNYNTNLAGNKDRLLYITYLGLFKQLDPEGLFLSLIDFHTNSRS